MCTCHMAYHGRFLDPKAPSVTIYPTSVLDSGQIWSPKLTFANRRCNSAFVLVLPVIAQSSRFEWSLLGPAHICTTSLPYLNQHLSQVLCVCELRAIRAPRNSFGPRNGAHYSGFRVKNGRHTSDAKDPSLGRKEKETVRQAGRQAGWLAGRP